MIRETDTYRMAARLFGIFFILTFLSYGTGSGLVSSIADGPKGLADIFANRTTFMIGIVLMTIVHTVFNIGLSVLMFSVLKSFNSYLALGYLCAAVVATLTVAIGALFFALLVPLSIAFIDAGTGADYFETLAVVLQRGGFYGYQFGMTMWGLGGLILCYILFTSRLVPRILAICGLLGYVIFITGTISELFGYQIGTVLSLPGGLFEVSLSLWLIFKGFKFPEAIVA